MLNKTTKSCLVLTTYTAVSNLRKTTFKILLILWKDIREGKKAYIVPWEKKLDFLIGQRWWGAAAAAGAFDAN